MTGDFNHITILSFNVGVAGRYVNGPGICLYNLINFLKVTRPDISINVFSHLKPKDNDYAFPVYSITDKDRLYRSIDKSQIVHNWSGITKDQKNAIKYSNMVGRPVILGPNCIDTVELEKESSFLSEINFKRLLTVNDRLRHKISLNHNISVKKIQKFLIGPDIKLWSFDGEKENFILWKGNSKHFVKDVEFGIKVAKKLNKYNFKFIGHPNPYNYFEHIDEAKRAKIYFSTSLSETMGVAMIEQWAASTPSVTHPKIYLHGENYKTGIITNRSVDAYCDAICEIMENDALYSELSIGAKMFAKENFNKNIVTKNYIKILNGCK